ncbi:unnamed protein product [Trichogramma brassicae]|uniref:Uncharacterized protein n=1 Tax=Trichogramma brassicae TaxID=86971 RepID=A0A6H5J573_9HYME|nr:unnamed protein product [Trichogramma brassicae]
MASENTSKISTRKDGPTTVIYKGKQFKLLLLPARPQEARDESKYFLSGVGSNSSNSQMNSSSSGGSSVALDQRVSLTAREVSTRNCYSTHTHRHIYNRRAAWAAAHIESKEQFDDETIIFFSGMRENTDWESGEERHAFLHQFEPFIEDYEGEIRNLEDIFPPKAMESLLFDCIDYIHQRVPASHELGVLFIRFVAFVGYKDKPKLDEDGKPSLLRATPLHRAAYLLFGSARETVRDLFAIYDKRDVNYVDEDGLTHLHVACLNGCEDIVEKFLELGADPDCRGQRSIRSPPLQLAVMYRQRTTMEVLLRGGADPNLSKESNGYTPLHHLCKSKNDSDLTQRFFRINDELNRSVRIDPRDAMGRTPLHYALYDGYKATIVRLLLNRGADPNSATATGSTPLHIICKRKKDDDTMQLFFQINEDRGRTVQIDARDKMGRTPLHTALAYGNDALAERLLRRGADPNLATANGSTPLHWICGRGQMAHRWAEKFFEINRELDQVIQVDARDKSGLTPLQLAVLNLAPDMIDLLLDNGADLSSFVFPTVSGYFDQSFPLGRNNNEMKLGIATGALAILERLEERGYQLVRKDALMIMALFTKYELFEKNSTDLEQFWFDDESFATEAKDITMRDDDSSLTLYDLIRLRPAEAAKQLTYSDYYEFYLSRSIWLLPESHERICVLHLCEKMSRGFFRLWALDPFMELTGYRLPVECSAAAAAK